MGKSKKKRTMAARRLIPLLDRVLIKRIEPPTKSIGGILLPKSSQTKLNQGTVLSVGPGRRDADGKLIAMDLKANDTVMLPQLVATRWRLKMRSWSCSALMISWASSRIRRRVSVRSDCSGLQVSCVRAVVFPRTPQCVYIKKHTSSCSTH